jgi:hypothetical protein
MNHFQSLSPDKLSRNFGPATSHQWSAGVVYEQKGDPTLPETASKGKFVA